MSFPVPQGRQREVVYLPEHGHTVVLGTAGSGKTTMAILRANYLAELSRDGTDRVLLVTFTPTTLLNEVPREGAFSGGRDTPGAGAVASQPRAARRHPPGRL